MAPAAQLNLYCDDSDLAGLLSQLGVDARLDDDASATRDAGEDDVLRLCREWATAQVKMYCLPHYDDSELARSWVVNWWATVLAAHQLCSRRLNQVPDSIRALLFGSGGADRGVMGELRDVHADRLKVPECRRRNPDDAPAWSNVVVDPRYRMRQARVQRPISERTPTQYPQTIDWPSEHRQEF